MGHHKRERVDILADILRAAKELEDALEDARDDKIPPTNITSKALVAYDRGARYLAEARELGLLDERNIITEEGQVYLSRYSRLIGMLGGRPHM